MAPSMNGIGATHKGLTAVTEMTGGASSNDENVATFWTRYGNLKQNGAMMNYLLEDVLSRYEHLSRKHNQYVEEHKEERTSAAALQLRQTTNETNIQHLQGLLNSNPFVLVLIDADEIVFNGIYLQQGEAGGRQVAAVLHDAIYEWAITNVIDCPTDVKIVLRAYANVKSLAVACARSGIVDSSVKVEQFFRGFTYDEPLFDFVDVGAGRDRVISKIIETFSINLSDYHCRQILFGCTHDCAYVTLLERYRSVVQAKDRITLLEGAPFERELATLPIEKKKIPGIFRESKIILPGQADGSSDIRSRVDSRGLNGASGVFTPRTNTPSSCATSNGDILAHRPAHLRLSSTSSCSPRTWSNIARENAAQPLTDLVRSSMQDNRDTIKRNKYGQRVDIDLEYDRDLVQEIKRLKSCNQHYLGPGCCHYLAGKADKCPHHHEYNLSAAQLKTLRVVARETPCKKGHECDEPKCFYGHKCPFPEASEGSMRGGACLNGSGCRFPRSMHGMDLNVVRTIRIS